MLHNIAICESYAPIGLVVEAFTKGLKRRGAIQAAQRVGKERRVVYTSSSVQFSLGMDSLDTVLAQVLGAYQQQTGLLTLWVAQTHYCLALHQGTVRGVFRGEEQLLQRLQVVGLLQELMALPAPLLRVGFVSCAVQALPGEAVPMNLQSLLLSVQAGLRAKQQEQLKQATITSTQNSYSTPGGLQAVGTVGRIPLPAPEAQYVRSGLVVDALSGETYALWQQLESQLVTRRSVSAQQLAEQLNIGIGQARVKVYRMVLLGLLVPAS